MQVMSWFGARKRRRSAPPIGEREFRVLESLWQSSPRSAQSVLADMSAEALSLSTVQSTLERLHRKALVERSKEGRAYLYSPLLSREDIISALLTDISEEIAGGDMAPMISGFMAFMKQS